MIPNAEATWLAEQRRRFKRAADIVSQQLAQLAPARPYTDFLVSRLVHDNAALLDRMAVLIRDRRPADARQTVIDALYSLRAQHPQLFVRAAVVSKAPSVIERVTTALRHAFAVRTAP